MASLEGVHAKFNRARVHANAFDALGQQLANSRPYGFTGQMESDGWYRVRWKLLGTLPPLDEFSLTFGDMLYNLRACLDYLVWQLVEVNGGTPDKKTSFPCVKNSVNWASAVGNNLRGIDPTWIAEIARLQPFDPSHAGNRPEIHPLAILDHVNNINKHRLLPAALVTFGHVAHEIKLPPDHPGVAGEQFFTDAVIEDGAEHFRVRVTPPVDFSVQVDQNPTLRISFGDGLNHDWRNRDLVDWVRNAIAVFEPAFPS